MFLRRKFFYAIFNEERDFVTGNSISPIAALDLEIKLVEAMTSLQTNPQRTPIFSERMELTPLQNIRKLVVDNYLILFYIDEKRTIVNIVSVHPHLRSIQ